MGNLFGSKQQKQISEFKPSAQQQELINLALPKYRQFAAAPPAAPSESAIAPFNPTQQQAQELALGAAAPQAEIASGAAGANQFLLGDVLYPGSNPALQEYIRYATEPVTERLLEQALPVIRGETESLGQFGGTRRGLVESAALRDAMRQTGGISSQIASQAYGQGLDALVKGLGLAPTTAGLQTTPAATVGGVGDVRYNLEQALLSEAAQQEQLQGMWPLLIGQEILGAQAGIPGGQNITTANAPSANPIASGLGGAATGAALGSVVPGIGTGIGAAAGGTLGLLSALFA